MVKKIFITIMMTLLCCGSVCADVVVEDIASEFAVGELGIVDGAVALEDVLEWNQTYQNREPVSISQEDRLKAMERYGTEDASLIPESDMVNDIYYGEIYDMAVPFMVQTSYQSGFGGEASCVVFDEEGQPVFLVQRTDGESSSASGAPYLRGCVTGKFISLKESVDEVAAFVEEEYEARAGRNHISQMDEEQLPEYWNALEQLWTMREELGIVGIGEGTGYQPEIYGCHTEAEFEALMVNSGYTGTYSYLQAVRTPNMYMNAELLSFSGKENLLDEISGNIEDVEYLADALECELAFAHKEYADSDKLKAAITKLQNTYPEYSARNLYYHVAGDCKAEDYLNFEEDLIAFVDSLPAYVPSKNVVVEYEFGDPERLELKRALRQCKEAYPDMSYQELYDKYLKEIEENTEQTKEEKLYRYLWMKYSGEINAQEEIAGENVAQAPAEDNGEGAEKKSSALYPVIAIGAVCVVVALLVVRSKKHK